MTRQEYWDFQLTHQGREKSLAAIGRALGYQFAQWNELPQDLRRSLARFWGKIETK